MATRERATRKQERGEEHPMNAELVRLIVAAEHVVKYLRSWRGDKKWHLLGIDELHQALQAVKKKSQEAPMNIKTSHWLKPIPSRNYDWEAINSDNHDIGHPVGFGRTEHEAVADLLRKQSEDKDERPTGTCAVCRKPTVDDGAPIGWMHDDGTPVCF